MINLEILLKIKTCSLFLWPQDLCLPYAKQNEGNNYVSLGYYNTRLDFSIDAIFKIFFSLNELAIPEGIKTFFCLLKMISSFDCL